jgi:P27 family predicted phage terminase small subunit
MARGRKPLPPEVRDVKGTARPDRHDPNRIHAIQSGPEFSWVGDPAIEAWCEHITVYIRAENRASKSDENIIVLAARKMVEIKKLDGLIERLGGPVYWKGGADGMWKAQPAVGQLHEAERQLQSCLSDLGLTPVSRNRVSAALKSPEVNEWEADFAAVGPEVRN